MEADVGTALAVVRDDVAGGPLTDGRSAGGLLGRDMAAAGWALLAMGTALLLGTALGPCTDCAAAGY